MVLVQYPLSRDGVASIRVLGTGTLHEKSSNLLRKAVILEQAGFLFPRRNLVVTADVLLEGLRTIGIDKGWSGEAVLINNTVCKRFGDFVRTCVWSYVEEIFEGRAFYVRSDAPGDSLGRGIYLSIPFVNKHTIPNVDKRRMDALTANILAVIDSYFTHAARAFREKHHLPENGINILLSQFIGRVGDFPFEGDTRRKALAPFLSAVVKTRLVRGKDEAIMRFEYGMGRGALRGRTLRILGDPVDSVETVYERRREIGMNTSFFRGAPEIIVLPEGDEMILEPSNSSLIRILIGSAYQLDRDMCMVAGEMLFDVISRIRMLERANNGVPLYLELVASSYKKEGTMRWFAVQAADYESPEQVSAPPQEIDFISNDDFSGHGIVEGRKTIYVFGPDAFKDEESGIEMLKHINETERDFVVILPQSALSGLNIAALSADSLQYFSNACAVIEYERLRPIDTPRRYHLEGPSSEHFQQLALDFKIIFIPTDCPLESVDGQNLIMGMADDAVLKITADVVLACDRERGIGWGKISPSI